MLLEFKVSNFMSIKDEIKISCLANSATEHEDNNFVFGNERILPSLAVYGYNAVGKSNIFKALTTAILFVRNSSVMQINTIIPTTPFLLDDNSRNEPTRMDFLFIHNGKKFSYGFEITNEKVLQEYLYEYTSSRPSMIFERKNDNYNFTTQNNKELEAFVDKNTSNKLFLSTATMWNCQLTKDAFLWFAEGVDTYDTKTFADSQYLEFLDINKDNPATKEFLLDILRTTDFNISDYVFDSKTGKDVKIVLPPGISFDQAIIDQMKINSKEFKLEALHDVVDNSGNKKSYPIDFIVESNGTKLMFAYAPIIQNALEKGRTIVVDEFNNSLHSALSKYLIKMFHDKNKNKKGAQLIFNTHDTSLLDSDLFRRDQIYFVEKEANGQTKTHLLHEYKVRRNDNFRKGYFDGRYSSLPDIANEFDW